MSNICICTAHFRCLAQGHIKFCRCRLKSLWDSSILPETCRLESMEVPWETPCCPPHTQHRAACYWSSILSSEKPAGRMQCTSAIPNTTFVYHSDKVWNVYCAFQLHGVDSWPFFQGPTACRTDSLSPVASVRLPPHSQMKRPPLPQSVHPGISAK